ncbi:alpha/beta hydrolase [Corynebacterium mendelii]|uniref:Alpha/beta hydrolase n=1 Tax=Corynebacterium mendelii TaxID=2765362 RepID=A0A939DYN5_9CORY|nr:alpha/beta hydrolase [Corynebacterium mendelii]MBN9643245.1 alpha/beta hydrolase [Corynebacterium mendelii]
MSADTPTPPPGTGDNGYTDVGCVWYPDELGPDYEKTTIELGPDPNGEGDVACTLIRYRPAGWTPADTAMLHVHGMTDYFFQTHAAEFFARLGLDYSAVDLRKCGRSHRPGQRFHHCLDLSEYFGDLDAAMDVLLRNHRRVVMCPHSTGGIITALWADYLRRGMLAGDADATRRHNALAGAIFNSPWLDIMVPPAAETVSKKLITFIGGHRPDMKLPGFRLGTYWKSIHVSADGEWDYNLNFKPFGGFPMTWGWTKAVADGQKKLHDGGINMGVPCLVVTSSRSRLSKPFSAKSHRADVVLNVHQCQKWAPNLAEDVTIVSVPGAKHDVYLSEKSVRNRAMAIMARWLLNRSLGNGVSDFDDDGNPTMGHHLSR